MPDSSNQTAVMSVAAICITSCPTPPNTWRDGGTGGGVQAAVGAAAVGGCHRQAASAADGQTAGGGQGGTPHLQLLAPYAVHQKDAQHVA